MPSYDVRFYTINAFGTVPTGRGSSFTWNGPATPEGRARITDEESGIEGRTLDDDSAGSESARADVQTPSGSSSGSRVDAEAVWTVIDTVTGESFQIVAFDVEQGSAAGDYMLSEVPLVQGRSYRVESYDSNPNAASGDAAFSYADYTEENGVVEGTEGGDVIDASYRDYGGEGIDHGASPDDSILGFGGDDTIYGGAGGDTIDGGSGADVIYGGSGKSDGGPAPERLSEMLRWNEQGGSGTNVAGGFTQNTGAVDVSLSFRSDGNNDPSFLIDNGTTQYGGPEDFAANSSLRLYGRGDGETSTSTISFSSARDGYADTVENVSFRINDIDWGRDNHTDIVTVNAYDAAGNPIDVVLTPGGGDRVDGNTVTANTVANSAAQADGSVLVEVAGPVASIEVSYANGQGNTQAIWLTDMRFDAVPVEDGGDLISGGTGADRIFGEAGDDTISGGADGDTIEGGTGSDSLAGDGGADSLSGGDGADTLSGGDGGDTLAGGAGADSLDGGAGADALDGGGGADTLSGGAGDDTLAGGAEADRLDGGEGDDSLSGGTGSDTLSGGAGADDLTAAQGDQVSGGAGDDRISLADLNEDGRGEISIDGGTEDQRAGDTLDLAGLADRSTLRFTTDETTGESTGSVQMRDGTTVKFRNIDRIVCFTPGTLIRTAAGWRRVEVLEPGDLLETRDRGLAPLRWVGRERVTGQGATAPVEIPAGALPGLRRLIRVSPQHRFVLGGKAAELLFGTREVFVTALHLAGWRGIRQRACRRVDYFHLALDRHEVIFAEGVPTESFFLGPTGLATLRPETRKSLQAALPALVHHPQDFGETARPCLRAHETRALLRALDGEVTEGASRRRSPQPVG
ncbi:Hint domain-containing protein [Roseivivax sp. GX 12232]|uniref:Hint domain-containing protein n=1 Tax=Roseivivax sp. GX 12232 TaxID=2900547 RepID=UPI001E2A10E7|nr:Hint domain-containing protein [Roseivivax sp. GX 12232]MCE0503789.1 Hint domain-containing protein [Roseivivax sp. GX 12232]